MEAGDQFTRREENTPDGEGRTTLLFAGLEVDVAECLGTEPDYEGRDAGSLDVNEMVKAVQDRVTQGNAN